MSPSQPSIERLNTGRFLIFSVLVVFFGCYISLVPEPNELLPGLKSIDLDLKNELDLIYPEDIYEGNYT